MAVTLAFEMGTLGLETREARADRVEVTAYFEPQLQPEELAARLRLGWRSLGQRSATLRIASQQRIEARDWVDNWRRQYRPISVGQRFRIQPSWLAARPPAGRVPLVLDPENAFGSGTHASTRLCLLGIEEFYRSQAPALDVGTGSGILAIAMARLARRRRRSTTAGRPVTAIDPDTDAVRTARRNAARNGVAARIRFATRPLEVFRSREPFRFVAANLTATDLESGATALAALSAPDALVLLSGLQVSDVTRLRRLFRERGFRHVKTRVQQGWALLVLRRAQQ